MDKLTSILAVVEDATPGSLLVVDKAVWLARQFGARLELLAAETKLLPLLSARCAGLSHDRVTLGCLVGRDEPPHRSLLRHVQVHAPDLLIKAPTSERVDCRIARECPAPLLLAGPIPWRDPARIAAAVDVSDPDSALAARAVLQAAGFLALGCAGDLDILYGEREREDEPLRMERAVRLAQLVREFRVGCERIQMFDGAPEDCLPRLISARRYDLLVVALCPSCLGTRLAEVTEGDVLVAKSDGGERHAARGLDSRLEKALHQG